ncbi:uncharacterized protein LOC142541752 isoform X2 [Primulina tabacum]|uniref:uncharacterized protein LOC142541752 isoform X2 n=1 Tax=Primulina tabacum TaxID=48773 RepID=UPI003F59E4FE
MARKRKAGDVGKMAYKGKAPTSEKSIGEEKEHSETAQTVLESKDVENNMPEDVSHIEHTVETENLVEKGKEGSNSCQQVGTVPSLDERNTKQKVCRTTNADPSSELGYKSMYITSQKQIEYLMAENCRLSMKLEFARGKIEAYEKVNDAIRTTKDVILVDSIRGKTQENAIGNADSAPDADNHVASPEKNDSKNASNIANEQKKVSRQRKKNC